MPVYELLGGKARDAVSLYAHAGDDAMDPNEVVEQVHKYTEEIYTHVRAQLGGDLADGYGGAASSRPERRVVRSMVTPAPPSTKTFTYTRLPSYSNTSE